METIAQYFSNEGIMATDIFSTNDKGTIKALIVNRLLFFDDLVYVKVQYFDDTVAYFNREDLLQS